MAGLNDIVQWQTVSGDNITIGDVTLTPQSQALTVHWPNGGFVWNRPVAVLVERVDGTERIPIVDVTRQAQLALVGLSILFSIISVLASTRQRRRDRNE